MVEFGDGTQYQVDGSNADSQSREDTDNKKSEIFLNSDHHHFSEQPVSKEERFVEDFDRSWPKSRGGAPPAQRVPRNRPVQGDISPVSVDATISSVSSAPSHSRVLFNERSNRMEPYSHLHKFNGSGHISTLSTRRGSHYESC